MFFLFQWFKWILYYKSADHKPLGIGKQYSAYFRMPMIGNQFIIQIQTSVVNIFVYFYWLLIYIYLFLNKEFHGIMAYVLFPKIVFILCSF